MNEDIVKKPPWVLESTDEREQVHGGAKSQEALRLFSFDSIQRSDREISLQGGRMKRPVGVTILAVLMIVQGLMLAALVVLVLALKVAQLAGELPPNLAHVFETLAATDVVLLAANGVIAVFAVVSGIGMFQLHSWAWLMALILQGIQLGIYLFLYFLGSPNYVAMLVSAIIVFYLNQRTIRQAFGVLRYRGDMAATRLQKAETIAVDEASSTLMSH